MLTAEVKWTEYWLAQTGVEWEAIMNSDKPVYVIIDEVQVGYPKDSPVYGLWAMVKRVINEKAQQVRFIFIGSYGEPQSGGAPTPFHDDIQPGAIISLHTHNGTYLISLFIASPIDKRIIGTPGLAYVKGEFLALCKSFETFCRIPIDDRCTNFIYYISEGNPGIVGVTLRCLYDNRKHFSLDGILCSYHIHYSD